MSDKISPLLKNQIVATYDNNPEVSAMELAEAFGLETETVQFVLESHQSKRVITEPESEYYGSQRLLTKATVDKACKLLDHLLDNDEANVQLRAAELVLKVATGNMAPKNILNQFNTNITVTQLNDAIKSRLATYRVA